MKRNKILTLLLALGLVLALVLSACGGGGAATTTTAAAATTAAATTAAATTAAATEAEEEAEEEATTTAATTAAATTAAATTAAAATEAATEAPVDDSLPFVEFSWYLGLTPMPDNQMVNDAINEYLGPILNAKVNINYWTSKDWEEKMTIMVASGDDLGIIGFGSQSKLDYVIQSQRGSFYPLEGLMDIYGAGTKALFPQDVWDCMTINGHVYGIPSLKDNCYIISLIYNEDMANELGVDMSQSNYKNFASIEPFYNMVMDLRDEVYGDIEEPLSGGIGLEMPYWFACESFLNDSFLAVCNIEGIMDFAGHDAENVFNLYATQEYRDACKSVQRMVDRNILAYDYEGKTAWNPSGNIFGWPGWGYTYLPEHLFGDAFYTRMIEPVRVWTDTNNYFSAGTAISANSKTPERCMMLLEMVNNDPKLATMMRFGIEGEHYVRTPEGGMTFEGSPRNSDAANRGYHYWYAAPVGNLLIVEAPEAYSGPDGIMLTKIAEFNRNAKIPNHLGFVFDIEPVNTELAACQSVVLEYRDDLRNGRLASEAEVDRIIDEFIAKLDANGAQIVLAEVQSQIDAWKASR